MISAKRKTFKTKPALVLALFSLMTVLATGGSTHAQGRSSISALLNSSGLSESSPLAKQDVYFEHLDIFQLGDGEIQSLKNIVSRYYDPADFTKTLKTKLTKSGKADHVNVLRHWYRSSLGKKIVAEEIISFKDDHSLEIRKYNRTIKNKQPDKKRIELINQLADVMQVQEFSKEHAEILMQLTFPYRNPSLGVSIIKEKGKKLRDRIIQTLSYRYRNLSSEELEEYVDFSYSPPMKWFNNEKMYTYLELLDVSVDKGILLLNKVIGQIRSGQGGYALLKEIFPPGERYRLIVQRDPFESQISSRKAKNKEKERLKRKKKSASAEKRRRRLANLNSRLSPIPLEILKNLKNDWPELYNDLERYSQIFSDSDGLMGMDDEAFNSHFSSYKKLIRSARQFEKDLPKTPLQSDYKKFRLVGVLQKGSQKIAMVQKQGLGLTIKKGALMGPNFGIVSQIDSDKIVILEQARDYSGNIFSKKKELKFSNNRKNKNEASS